ncbi:CAP domain-containing protein [uncultured Tateyamaria sp.]|uniref:CAP domain-containing protein n=1 Tax=uncultured Tateyamaria sp. TaxID=455651 RepID=UPI002602D13E|nr:CAP domain-containing protein [uncultured Tateyamaria sp.]
MSEANQYEQQMLDLINAERAAVGLNPVVFNNDLNESSEDHSAWMIETDSFTHAGVDGSSSRERIEAAGYELEGNWKTGENIAWVNEDGGNGLSDEVVRLHTNLMNSPEHRANILNPDFEEIGIGIEVGEFDDNGTAVEAVFVTQNFGTSSATTVTLPSQEENEMQGPTPPSTIVETATFDEDSNETPVETEEAPEIVAGNSFDIAAFMASQGFAPTAPATDETDNAGPTITTGSSTSSVEVSSVASMMDGPSVTVDGEGNFSGGGLATVEETTAMEFDEGTNEAPVETEEAPEIVAGNSFDIAAFMASQGFAPTAPATDETDNAGPTVTTGSSTSSVEVSSVASMMDGPSVTVDGEGNFSGGGLATVEETTVAEFDEGTNTTADNGADQTAFDPSANFDTFVFDMLASFEGASETMTNGAVVQSTAEVSGDAVLEILAMLGEFELSFTTVAPLDTGSLPAGNFENVVENNSPQFDATFFEDFVF